MMSAHVDHQLEGALSRVLESHLNECADCRALFEAFQEIDGIVSGLPRIEPGPDFAERMVMRVRGSSTAGEVEPPDRVSMFERLIRLAGNLVDLAQSARTPRTGTLDEFNDFPPLSIGCVYFKLVDLPARG